MVGWLFLRKVMQNMGFSSPVCRVYNDMCDTGEVCSQI
jgi:hypothetical protein